MKTKVRKMRCPNCRKVLPLTREYWYSDKLSNTGFQRSCKECESAFMRLHHVHFTRRDMTVKGSFGVPCPLYASNRCGICEDLAECWRIVDVDPADDEYPDKLLDDKLWNGEE